MYDRYKPILFFIIYFDQNINALLILYNDRLINYLIIQYHVVKINKNPKDRNIN